MAHRVQHVLPEHLLSELGKRARAWRLKHPRLYKKRNKEYYWSNRKKMLKARKEYFQKNPNCNKDYYKVNRERLLILKRAKRRTPMEKAKAKAYRDRTRKHYLAWRRRSYKKNRDHIREQKRGWYSKNKEHVITLKRKWRVENRERHLKTTRAYRERNREKLNEKSRIFGNTQTKKMSDSYIKKSILRLKAGEQTSTSLIVFARGIIKLKRAVRQIITSTQNKNKNKNN